MDPVPVAAEDGEPVRRRRVGPVADADERQLPEQVPDDETADRASHHAERAELGPASFRLAHEDVGADDDPEDAPQVQRPGEEHGLGDAPGVGHEGAALGQPAAPVP